MLFESFRAAVPCINSCPFCKEARREPLLATEATRDVTAAAAAWGMLAAVAARAASACALWRAAVAAAAIDALDGERSCANCLYQ